jgi:hypothetical protein
MPMVAVMAVIGAVVTVTARPGTGRAREQYNGQQSDE